MIEPLVVWGALGALALFTSALIKRYLDHLESDLAYSRKTAVRGTELAEKGADMAEQKAG